MASGAAAGLGGEEDVEPAIVDVVLHLDGAKRRVEDRAAATMPTVEAARVASVQAVDGSAQTALAERAEQVVAGEALT